MYGKAEKKKIDLPCWLQDIYYLIRKKRYIMKQSSTSRQARNNETKNPENKTKANNLALQ